MSMISWTPRFTRRVDDLEPDLLDEAIRAAQEVLDTASGQRFGERVVTRERYWGAPLSARERCSLANTVVNHGFLSRSYLAGSCAFRLGHPHVRSVEEVRVDDLALDPSMWLLVGSQLVRLGACWPSQRPGLQPPIAVSYTHGAPLSGLGQLALGELALDLYDSMDRDNDDCGLPAGVTTITRQGVSVNVEAAQQLDGGSTQLPLVTRWLTSVNPGGLRARSKVVALDAPRVAR